MFFFQRTEERFGHRIIQDIAMQAHIRGQVIGPTEVQPVITAVLAVLFRVHDDLAVRVSVPDGHHKRIQRNFARVGFTYERRTAIFDKL